ncbi:hypothetical protein NLI96_g1906 [Meripilus lineatus]|uniref:F-box domain-containing protein n=1 Tax=Meripilus lineatus TaxID=2056292 RepID=A0AAD5V9Q9_9APHY|nr:hypothetical protein NLI96_g1906 [Physisporinus lineatus]
MQFMRGGFSSFFNFSFFSRPKVKQTRHSPDFRILTSPAHQTEAHEVDLAFAAPSTRPLVRRRANEKLPVAHTHIPIEVVLSILEEAYYTQQAEPDYALLMSCALVSRDWSLLAQKLLFRNVIIRSQSDFTAFQHATNRTMPRGRVLGDAVQRLRLVLDPNHPSSLSQSSFARAVTLCPNLSELSISLFGKGAPGQDVVGSPDIERMRRAAPAFDESTLSMLKSGPSVTSLEFTNWSDNATALAQLLSVWPSLKSLTLIGNPPSPPSLTPEPLSCSLEALRMNFQTSPSIDFLKWLLRNSSTSLRTLEFDREPSPEVLDHVLGEHGSSLHTLSLPTCSSRKGNIAFTRCSNLHELRIERIRDALGAFKAMPITLEHVAVGVSPDSSLQPLLQLIKKSGDLRAVTMHLWNGCDNHPHLASVKIACTVRGIDLRISKDIKEFRICSRGLPRPL